MLFQLQVKVLLLELICAGIMDIKEVFVFILVNECLQRTGTIFFDFIFLIVHRNFTLFLVKPSYSSSLD